MNDDRTNDTNEAQPSPETADTPTPPQPVAEPPKPPAPPAPEPPKPIVPEPAGAPDQALVPEPQDNYAGLADDAPPRDPRLKSPIAAAVLSLVPFGLGHLYLGQYSRAFTFFAGFWMPILFLEWPMPLVGVFVYFFAVFDAVRQAQLINLAVGRDDDAPASSFSGGLAAGIFLIVLGLVLLLNYHFDLYFIREFVHDWWPAFLILVGIWFIFGAIRDRSRAGRAEEDETF